MWQTTRKAGILVVNKPIKDTTSVIKPVTVTKHDPAIDPVHIRPQIASNFVCGHIPLVQTKALRDHLSIAPRHLKRILLKSRCISRYQEVVQNHHIGA
jgi:hypothetical protein